MKTCAKCGIEKELSEFSKDRSLKSGRRSDCKECRRSYYKEYYAKNQEKLVAYRREYVASNRERVREEHRARYRRNREKFSERNKAYYRANTDRLKRYNRNYRNSREYDKTRYHENVLAKLAIVFRNRTREVFRGATKPTSSCKLLGCTYEIARLHIEKQLKDGMSWDNYGEWHIDHFFPLSKADLTVPAQAFAACNWRNLRPVWAKENISKKDRIYPEAQKLFDELCREFSEKEDAA